MSTFAVPELTKGWRLRMAREHAELSATDIADRLEVSQTRVSVWERDHRPIPRVYLKEWAAICRVPVDWLETGCAPSDSNREPADYRFEPLRLIVGGTARPVYAHPESAAA